MTTDPRPVDMTPPDGWDWYWPAVINDDEWEAWGRDPSRRSRHNRPSAHGDAFGPVLARRKPPEPWAPKKGDWANDGEKNVAVRAVDGAYSWVLIDGDPQPCTIPMAYLSPLPYDTLFAGPDELLRSREADQ